MVCRSARLCRSVQARRFPWAARFCLYANRNRLNDPITGLKPKRADMADTLPQTRLMRPVRDKVTQVALLATLGALCACSTMPSADTRDHAAVAPPPAASVPAASLPAAPMSPVASTVPAANHFQAAMQFLQSGEPQRADEELHAYLKLVPDNKPA